MILHVPPMTERDFPYLPLCSAFLGGKLKTIAAEQEIEARQLRAAFRRAKQGNPDQCRLTWKTRSH